MAPERKKQRKATPKAFLWDSSFDIIWSVDGIIFLNFSPKFLKIERSR